MSSQNIPSILDSYFSIQTMSVHIRAWQIPLRKLGEPGSWHLEHIDTAPLDAKQCQKLIDTLYTELHQRDDARVEIDRKHSKVIQLWAYRIVIVQAPVSDALEITIVRPTTKTYLEDYSLDSEIVSNLLNTAKWVLISWSPGEGKTTFAQALVEEIAKSNVVIKTIESPRDMDIAEHITQYSFSHAPHNEIRDILLLSRPDRTIYDEVRNKEDFILYKDLRLSGIWLIGVMHATHAIDSLQRCMSVIDMWSLGQVIDTVIFIKSGAVQEVLSLEHTVKVPLWMESNDLARPVILVKTMPEQEIRYEIYSYGETTVVMPVDELEKMQEQEISPIHTYASKAIQEKIFSLTHQKSIVHITGRKHITMYIPKQATGKIIGKWGSRIEQLQKDLWLSISVKPMNELHQKKPSQTHWAVPYTIEEIIKWKKTKIEIQLPETYAHQDIQILIGNTPMTFTANYNAAVSIRRKKLIEYIRNGEIEIIW